MGSAFSLRLCTEAEISLLLNEKHLRRCCQKVLPGQRPGDDSSGVRYRWSMVRRGFGSRQILAVPLTSCGALGEVTNRWESQLLISKMGMVISHSKGFWVNYHERTCVKSSVQSLAHSGCSITKMNVFDGAVAAASSLSLREPLTVKAGFLPALSAVSRCSPSPLF